MFSFSVSVNNQSKKTVLVVTKEVVSLTPEQMNLKN
jgi:hypothetical protein